MVILCNFLGHGKLNVFIGMMMGISDCGVLSPSNVLHKLES